jgi:hypothetical protein
MTIGRAGFCLRQKPRFRIETPLQDPYNKPHRPIPKTYFVMAIFEAAARALCRTASNSTAAGMILAGSNRAKEIASCVESYYFLTPGHRTCGYRSHVACSAHRKRMRARYISFAT